MLVEQIHHLVWSARSDGHIDFSSRRTLQYIGASLEQLQGCSWCNFVHPEFVPARTDVWRQAFTTGSESRVQFRLKRHDGTFPCHLAHALPFRHADGRILRWYGTCTDIGDQKQTDDALRKAVGKLQDKQAQLVQAAKLATVGELATGIAHELNSPLNNIALFTGNVLDYLRSGTSNNELQATSLEQVMQQVRKASKIIDHLRAFGRAASHVREPVCPNHVIQQSFALMEAQLRLREIEVVLDLAPGQCVVPGNPIQLEQVLINLLSNARDAVASAPEKRIRITSGIEDGHMRCEVADSGVGITPNLQSRIFDPFFTTKPVGKGTGLGLSISYAIVREHGETISVDSQPHEGSCFRLDLPLYQPAVHDSVPARL